MGGLAAKTFPWPTAIGNSQNVTPLNQSVAPTPNGPSGISATNFTSSGGTASPSTPSTPPAPILPVGQPQPFRPVTGRMPPLSPAFYGR